MSHKKILQKDKQPENFEFSEENMKEIPNILAKYPPNGTQGAMMSLLYMAQDQCGGWIPTAAAVKISEILKINPIKTFEVATFYSMYNLSPVGKYLVQVCRTTPCWLCGSDKITQKIKDVLSININETTSDNLFTLIEVECLGACIDAPIVQINNDYYERLTEESISNIIKEIKEKELVTQ